MEKIKEKIVSIIKTVLPDICFERLWAYYIKNNPKYDKDRYQCAYALSSQRSKEKYFIIRYTAPGMGVCAVARNIFFICEWAEKNKMIPIIDYEWENVFEDKLLGVDNIWEYVFEQPKSIQQVIKEKNVFVASLNTSEYYVPDMLRKLNVSRGPLKFVDENWREYYRKLNYYSNKWWQLKPDIRERYTSNYSKLFSSNMKILGVALREEFSMTEKDINMKETRLALHPHHLTLDAMINVIKEYKQKWGCTHVFVSTYMEDSIEKLQEEFGDALLYTNRKRVPFESYKSARNMLQEYFSKSVKELHEWINSGTEYAQIASGWDKETTVEYMGEIYGLSLCDCLLAGKSGGALAACIWNGGKYEKLEILSDENKSEMY